MCTTIVKTILNKTDEAIENLDPLNDKFAYAKVGALGFIQGAIDGAVIAYPILLGGVLYWKHKALKK